MPGGCAGVSLAALGLSLRAQVKCLPGSARRVNCCDGRIYWSESPRERAGCCGGGGRLRLSKQVVSDPTSGPGAALGRPGQQRSEVRQGMLGALLVIHHLASSRSRSGPRFAARWPGVSFPWATLRGARRSRRRVGQATRGRALPRREETGLSRACALVRCHPSAARRLGGRTTTRPAPTASPGPRRVQQRAGRGQAPPGPAT